MQLFETGREPSPNAELICRQSRLMAVVALAVYASLLIVAPLYAWNRGHVPGVFLGGLLGLALLLLPLITATTLSAFRRTNWCLSLEPDGLLINLRSYRNERFAPALTVLHLGYGEIVQATRHRVRMSSSHGDENVSWREQHLELQVKAVDLQSVRHAIASERQRRTVRSYFGGAIVSSGRQNHVPVIVVDDDRIRLAWRTRYDVVRPSIKHVLQRLENRIAVTEATVSEEIDDWDVLSDAEVDDLILRFVEADDKFSAMALLMRRREYTRTEAKQFVDGLGERLTTTR